MTDKQEHNPIEEPQFDPLMDTQRLLDLGPPAEGTFALEDILAEFGGEAGKTPARQESAQASEEPPPPPEDPESPPPEPQEAAEPEASPEEPLAEPERGEDPEALAEDGQVGGGDFVFPLVAEVHVVCFLSCPVGS